MGKHGNPGDINAYINLSTALREEKLTIEEIAETLDLSIDQARDYSRGFPSSSAYTKKLDRLIQLYKLILKRKLKELHFVGESLREVKKGKSIVMKFVKTNISVKKREESINASFYFNLGVAGLEDYMHDLICLHYKDGKYSFRTSNIRARAYINAYADVVLSREKIKVIT